MKALKRIIAVLFVMTTFVGGFAASYSLFSNGKYDFDVKKLSVFDDETDKYYLRGADKKIIFRVNCEDGGDVEYELFDSMGNRVEVKTQKAGSGLYDILPPSEGYVEGEQYTLRLGEALSFNKEDLAGARTLVFEIDKEAVEKYKFTDDVVEVDSVVKKVSEDAIDNSKLNLQVGEIVFGKDESGEYVVYKVTGIDGNNAIVDYPSIDEIYSDLEVYGEYIWDVDEIALNPDIEAEIVRNVRNSEFYKLLIETAYADEIANDNLSVKVEPNSDEDSLHVEIKIILKAGEKGLFGDKGLKYQDVTIELHTTLSLRTNCNIEGVKQWDISATLGNDFYWKVDVGFSRKFEPDDTDLEKLFKETNKVANLVEYHKNVRNITEKLNKLVADANAGEIKIFDWKVPVPSVPGLYFNAEIKLLAELELAADFTVSQTISSLYTVGVCYLNEEFSTYSNQYQYSEGLDVSLRGKAEAKAGVVLEISAKLINEKIAYVQIDPQAGLYAELYVTIPIFDTDEINDSSFLYSYFEPGVFFGANVEAKLNIGLKEFEYKKELVEKKFKIKSLTFGHEKIAIGLNVNAKTVRAADAVVSLPDILFEHYDVKEGKSAVERLDYKDVKFTTGDGTVLKESGGKITLPDITSSSSTYVTATYVHTDGKSYSTTFRVLVSGSIVEGKVSAYNTKISTVNLKDALVMIYNGSNRSTPIGSVRTDESGKFSFSVPAGTYTLVISADGYKTLVSTQTVKKDEIKYTEHILLIDDAQKGTGSAGGKISDALNGKGISGVTVKLRSEWNNTEGDYVDYETTTDASGNYRLENLPVGYYTVEASMDGYVTGYTNVIIISDSERTDFDFTITPILNDDEIRIVLTWGSAPADLDSHLLGYTPSNNLFNVYYSSKHYYYDGQEMANLDVDDRSSYGPETITILSDIYGSYVYAVHNYTNRSSTTSQALSLSGAVVRVFVGSEQIAEYNVPTDQVGTYWTVFEINDRGEITPINTISNEKPSPELEP